MSKNLGITLGLILVAVIGMGLLIAIDDRDSATSAPAAPGGPAGQDPTTAPVAPAELLVRENSRYLDQVEESPVTVVEFLDFECEACRAQFPVMEQIREDYDGRINMVIRYFPLPGHTNSEPAAAAVEAAAQQGALEEMYVRMYETQAEWGESQESQAEVFVGFAEDLGLDMAEFVRTMESPETLERVRSDFEDGVALGVQGTPTIFVNGRPTPSMPTYEVLSARIDAELEG
ncbi:MULTISPECIES: DsbA family protein [Nocardiopsis]|uniref:Disulfide bond formation protein DsbA n=1 Tax=Nocardiopsis sinuspersici TaxID=501010 RepID=A0A1V3C169_9ACTN|nr:MULTISPECIES: thioredoxin domain-containing protein [Nocardiopsis]OOC54229.1 disulfide bond formation protein DsbA [Nocardiopsis sinuspersici]